MGQSEIKLEVQKTKLTFFPNSPNTPIFQFQTDLSLLLPSPTSTPLLRLFTASSSSSHSPSFWWLKVYIVQNMWWLSYMDTEKKPKSRASKMVPDLPSSLFPLMLPMKYMKYHVFPLYLPLHSHMFHWRDSFASFPCTKLIFSTMLFVSTLKDCQHYHQACDGDEWVEQLSQSFLSFPP